MGDAHVGQKAGTAWPRRLASGLAAFAAFGVLAVGCGEDEPALESPGTQDTGGETQQEDAGGEGQQGLEVEGEEEGHGHDEGGEDHGHEHEHD